MTAFPELEQPLEHPTASELLEILEDIDAGNGSFLIVEQSSDPSGQTYMQLMLVEEGQWLVEYRDGRSDRHYATLVPQLSAAHGLLVRWMSGSRNWPPDVLWWPVSVPSEAGESLPGA